MMMNSEGSPDKAPNTFPPATLVGSGIASSHPELLL